MNDADFGQLGGGVGVADETGVKGLMTSPAADSRPARAGAAAGDEAEDEGGQHRHGDRGEERILRASTYYVEIVFCRDLVGRVFTAHAIRCRPTRYNPSSNDRHARD
jgi:hypothetical protein